MQKNNKEIILAQYLIENKDKLDELINIRNNKIELHYDEKLKIVEMTGEGENEEKIYVSIQLDKERYKEHIIQIQNFIVTSEAEKNNIILYIMQEFNEEVILELMQDVIFYNEKTIELIFVSVSNLALEVISNISVTTGEHFQRKVMILNKVEKIFLKKKGIQVYNRKI